PKLGGRASHDLVASIAAHHQKALVDGEIATFLDGRDGYRKWAGHEDFRESLLRLPQRVKGALSLGDVANDAQDLVAVVWDDARFVVFHFTAYRERILLAPQLARPGPIGETAPKLLGKLGRQHLLHALSQELLRRKEQLT